MDGLVVIDMQEASFTDSDKYDTEGVIDRLNKLSEYVRQNGGRVAFIQHDGEKEEGLVPFTKGWEILSLLIRGDGDAVIRKTTNDSFYKTGLDRWLRDNHVDRLIISGWATDFCVDTTVRAAVSHGYHVVVAADCHTVSNRPHLSAEKVIEYHNWIWKNLLAPFKAVDVLSLEEFLNENALG